MAQITLNSSGVASNGSLLLQSNGTTTAVTIDTAQNLGLGVTPSAWYTPAGYKVMQIGPGMSFDSGNDFRARIASNAFVNSGGDFKYVNTGFASNYNQSSGQHQWFNAASGTAGNTITFTQAMTLDSSGNLLVGTTSYSGNGGVSIQPSATRPQVYCGGSSTSNSDSTYMVYSSGASAYRFYVGYGGTISATNTTITGISDQRLKENIRDLDEGLATVMALKPRKFDWKAGKGADIKNARGFIAQEFETVLPDMIETWRDPAPEGEEPYKAINANLIPTLVKAIQELKAEFDAYKASHP